VTDPTSAEFLANLRPIPTYRDHPAIAPVDIEGVDPSGTAVRIEVLSSAEPVLLLFLSSACLGCRGLWSGTAELRRSLPVGVSVALVTRGPEDEDARAIAALAPAGCVTAMSSQAYRDYRVAGPPFLAVVWGREVRTEGVAWGVEETVRATRSALAEER
jgi:hypothetical protein